MAVDTQIANSAPGIASFAQESFADPHEARYGDGPWTETVLPLAPVGFALNNPIYSVVDKSGRLAEIAGLAGTEPYGIIVSPIIVADGGTSSVAILRAGNMNMRALTWHADFTTDDQKADTFLGSESPTIFIQKPALESAALY